MNHLAPTAKLKTDTEKTLEKWCQELRSKDPNVRRKAVLALWTYRAGYCKPSRAGQERCVILNWY